MKRILFIICISLIILNIDASAQNNRKTVVTIKNDQFLINGKPTYENRYWKGYKIEGLLMNSRMVQGVFDDSNPETIQNWIYCMPTAKNSPSTVSSR